MRIVQRIVLGLGLVVFLPIGGSAAFAAGTKQTLSQRQSGYAPIKRLLQPGAKDPGPGAVATIAGHPHMNASEYKDLKGAALTLLRKYSPATHYFVFLGRDAAPISAFVQNLGGKELALNFPASSNEAGHDTPQVMAQYVNNIIPAEVLKGGRKIVVVDATSSGRALHYWLPKITPHLNGVPAVKVAFANPGWGVHTNPGDIDVISTAPFPIVDQYFSGQYENGISEFPRHAPGAHPVSDIAQSRPEWNQFRAAIAQRMHADTELDKALNEIGGVEESTPEARRERKLAMAAQRSALAKQLVMERQAVAAAKLASRLEAAEEAKRVKLAASKLKEEVNALVGGLSMREESHEKGPYLGENGTTLNDWLVKAIATQGKADAVSPAAKQAGPNEVTLHFITNVLEKAVTQKQIRRRDYRRLVGHALGFSTMDAAMLKSLKAHYKTSKDMQRELTEEAEYYTNGSSKQPAGTQNMGANYAALMQSLGGAQ